MRIAVTMPGKMGDALYALPTIRHLYRTTGAEIDFYTSSYCEPLRSLFEYQSCVHSFIVPETYVIERMDMGVQPWSMPVVGEYDAIHHLGFQSSPTTALHQHMAAQIGIMEPLAIEYEVPKLDIIPQKPYFCVAPRGQTTFLATFNEVCDKIPAYVIGTKSDYMGHGIDMTGLDMLQTAAFLSESAGFFGLMSSQLVLANGFDIPRVALHDGRSWDMSHVIYYHRNFYPINPSADEVIQLLGL